MKLSSALCIAFFLTALQAYPLNNDSDNTFSDINYEQKIDSIMAEWNRMDIPGAAIGVVKNGTLIYSKGFGLANLEYDIPITPETIFHMASVSKQFTAYAIVLLEQQGKLSFTDDVRKYIPELPDFGKVITIKNLIHHTSGLRDQWDLLIMAGWRLEDVITQQDILRIMNRQKGLNFDPGDNCLYSNTGYTLLAEVVSRVTGKSFAEWTKENIFIPLGMDNTFFSDDYHKIVKNRSYSYNPAFDGFQKSNLSYSNTGATSLLSNINDLAKWVNNFQFPIVGSAEIIKQMEERAILNNGDTMDYAFGQNITEHNGYRCISHGGTDAGYRTFISRLPEENLSVIVLSNLGSFNAENIAVKIADLFLENKSTTENTANEEKKLTEEIKVDSTVLTEYTGRYLMSPAYYLDVTQENNSLMIQIIGQPQFPLFASSETSFFLKVVDAQVNFERDESGKVNKLIIHQNGMDLPFSREYKEPMDLLEYTGTYYSDELQSTYIVTVKDNMLTFQNVHINDLPVMPADKDKFLYSFNLGFDFGRDSENQVNCVKISTSRARNVLFEKR